MAFQATYVQEGNALDFRPETDVPAGAVVVQNSLVGVTNRPVPANTKAAGALAVSDELRDRAFSIMQRSPHLQFNLLTKRVEAMRDYISRWCERRGRERRTDEQIGKRRSVEQLVHLQSTEDRSSEGPLPNVRIGLSAGTQKYLDARWPFLRDTPAASRHLSLQPLLEPITLPSSVTKENLDWVVIMREVGPGARPMDVEWVGEIRSQCDARSMPFFWETTVFDDAEYADSALPSASRGTV